jgi:hypothetical protein
MTTRIQLRRDTQNNWDTINPLLYPGEIGIEIDTGKFKIGPAVVFPAVGTLWNNITSYSSVTESGLQSSLGNYVQTADVGIKGGLVEMDASGNALILGPGFIVEGETNNYNETTVVFTDPTTDRTITFPDATGTVVLADGSGNVTVSGDLIVNGTTTNINSTSLVIEDKNIVLGDTATPTDITADGGGITLKGATDKTFNWIDDTNAWTSSEHINLASGKTLKYNGTDLIPSQTNNSGKYLLTNGTNTYWANVELIHSFAMIG